jgi:hypothetical protein
MKMNGNQEHGIQPTLHRLVFIGGFAEFFLWHLLMLLGIIPILGVFFQFLFLKWLVKSTVLAPIELSKEDIRQIVQRKRVAEEVQKQIAR